MLKVENLSKVYYKNTHYSETFREEVIWGLRRMIGKGPKRKGTRFHALKDVSFELKKGEVLGVVGRNGSGKSTLLKILSRITAPSAGEVVMEGKSTAILNIGTGFHPDLSGRENIFLNGELMGQSREDIRKNFDKIVEFSGVGDFIDTQVKHYSNGMFLRLAFSIAFHAPVELLFLDEVLSVGDAEFRMKSLNHIEQLANQGVTIVMVTHNLNEVSNLCHRALWLDKGKMRALGPPMEILEEYIQETYAGFESFTSESVYFKEGHYRLRSIRIQAHGKQADAPIYTEDETEIEFKIDKLQAQKSLEITLHLYDMAGIRLLVDSYGLRTGYQAVPQPQGNYRIICRIPGRLLNRGYYRLNLNISENGSELVDTLLNVALFQIQVNPAEDQRIWDPQLNSTLRPHLFWEINPEVEN